MKYIKEDIEKILKEYPINEAKLTEIQIKKEEYQEELYYAGTVYEDTDKEIIENMQLCGKGYDNIHSNTNKISDKVLNTAINYSKEQHYINKKDRQYLESKIIECEAEENVLNKKIVRVKNLLTILSEKQRFVINEFYINSEKGDWKKVSKLYEKAFPKDLTIRQLQNIKDVALKDMLEVLNV